MECYAKKRVENSGAGSSEQRPNQMEQKHGPVKSGAAGSGEVVIHGPATRTRSKTSGNKGSAVRYVLASSALEDGDDSKVVNVSVPLGLAREMVQMQRDKAQRAQQEI